MKQFTLGFAVFLSLLLAVGCGQSNEKATAEFQTKLKTIQAEFRTASQAATSREAYEKATSDLRSGLTKLLDQYQDLKGDKVELIRVQALMGIQKMDEAEQKVDALLKKGSADLLPQIKLEKVGILLIRKKYEEAYKLFKEIENKLPANDRLHEQFLNFAFYAPTEAAREEYGRKFIALTNPPAYLVRYTPYVYQNLAYGAKDRGDLDGARKILNEGIAKMTDEQSKKSLQSDLKTLDLIGKPAIALKAVKWLNSKKLDLKKLKGKFVLVDFWATWCPPCRQVIPVLAASYNELKGKGLVVIGYTKYYGHYRDDQTNAGKVDKKRELELTEQFIKRFKINYPLAIADNDVAFEDYNVESIPTLFFIDRKGIIVDVEKGSGNAATLRERIKKLVTS